MQEKKEPYEEELVKYKHEKAVPYKREQLDWRKLVEQEEEDND